MYNDIMRDTHGGDTDPQKPAQDTRVCYTCRARTRPRGVSCASLPSAMYNDIMRDTHGGDTDPQKPAQVPLEHQWLPAHGGSNSRPRRAAVSGLAVLSGLRTDRRVVRVSLDPFPPPAVWPAWTQQLPGVALGSLFLPLVPGEDIASHLLSITSYLECSVRPWYMARFPTHHHHKHSLHGLGQVAIRLGLSWLTGSQRRSRYLMGAWAAEKTQ
ncbi:hypothetical protein TREES_T100008507 [Tupaia chinensis]|uniref:Uncharacterized protein n=1 Tax=Tupaia chinensis TaxID=246437 RepID=L9LDR7_TUPCH|nr:hypothetical protein TREES_T100008507 [Tupaia chinensis]